MQTFDRKVSESLIIGNDVEVTVLEIQEHFVRIGIRSSRLEPSYREETIYLEEAADTMELAIR